MRVVSTNGIAFAKVSPLAGNNVERCNPPTEGIGATVGHAPDLKPPFRILEEGPDLQLVLLAVDEQLDATSERLADLLVR